MSKILFAKIVAVSLASALSLSACSDPSSSDSADATNVTMSVRTSTVFRTDGGSNAVTVESAKVLLKQVKFQQRLSNDLFDVKVGPVAVNLASSGGSTEIALSSVPSGVYDEVRFRLHKPEDFEPIPDPEFREGPSGDQRYSVIVRGIQNGTPFVYKSRQNAEQRLGLAPPLSVQSEVPVHVTLLVDPATWFTDGQTAFDPTNPAYADAIDRRIRESFQRVFRDNDRNGEPD